MVTPRGQHAGDKGQQLFGAPVEAGFQEPSAARGANAFNSQEIPGTVVFIVISDHLPALLLTVPGPLLGLLPSSCSWWPFWLGSLSKENHHGTLCSTVGGLVGRFLRGKGFVSMLAGSRAFGYTFLLGCDCSEPTADRNWNCRAVQDKALASQFPSRLWCPLSK